MKIRTILCPVDYSDYSKRAAEYATVLAQQTGSSLTFLHSYLPEVTFGSQLSADTGEEERRQLTELHAHYPQPDGVDVRYEVRVGTPMETISQLAPEPDVIVLGTRGRTGLRRVLLGSVAEEIVRDVECPVIAIKAETPMAPWFNAPAANDKGGILCAVDANDYDQDVVDLAASLAGSIGRPLDLVHVTIFPDIAERPGCYGSPSDLIRDHQALKAIRTTCEDVELVLHHRSGSPTEQVLELAEERAPRLLILGTHGRRGLSRLLGSTASRILRKAECPVLILRQHEKASLDRSAAEGEDSSEGESSDSGEEGEPASACNCKCNGACGKRAKPLATVTLSDHAGGP